MIDFTLKAYKQYLDIIKDSYPNILRFDEFFPITPKPESFVIIRHDIDRSPEKALRMAFLENKMNICSTYYFRAKSHTFKPEIIKKIYRMGHEIGYHYESLSDTNGDTKLALIDFEKNLNRFRDIVPIKTISMHGRPFSSHDNRDLWRNEKNHSLLSKKFKILGEVYIDIEYKNIAYINDTGRNWNSLKANKRDTVVSEVSANFHGMKDLINFLKESRHSKIVFQIHPERWAQKTSEYFTQYIKDHGVNFLKLLFP